MIIPALGDSRTVKSGFVGLKGSDRDGFSWDLTVTKAINPSSEKDKGLGIMVYFSWSF
jgi:hemolysin activation/secretion protein